MAFVGTVLWQNLHKLHRLEETAMLKNACVDYFAKVVKTYSTIDAALLWVKVPLQPSLSRHAQVTGSLEVTWINSSAKIISHIHGSNLLHKQDDDQRIWLSILQLSDPSTIRTRTVVDLEL